MDFQEILTSCLTVCFFIFHGSAPVQSCQPPDSPEGGSYRPVQVKYLPGDKVAYSCKDKLTRIGKDIRVCQTTGKWSGMTPFCDSPTVVRNPSGTTDPKKEISNVIDGSPSTCYSSSNGTGQNLRVYLDPPATVNVVRIYLQKGKVNFKISLIHRRHSTIGTICTSYDRDIEESQWITLECKENDVQADYVLFQDVSDKANCLAICEIEVFVRDDVWCKNSPNIFIPNGFLEVSRDKATLQCAEGYRESINTRLVCEKNAWAGPNLQCEEILCDPVVGNETYSGEWHLLSKARKLAVGIKRKLQCNSGYHIVGKPDVVTCLKHGSWSMSTATCIESESEKKTSFRTIAIAVGTVVVVLIFVLLGLTLFLVHKKRAREVVVIYKPGEDAYSPQSFSTTGTTACSDAEYSTVYYDAIHNNPYPPTPSRPPRSSPLMEQGYSSPIDDRNTPISKITSNQLPADIAFGTLKSSSLYDSM